MLIKRQIDEFDHFKVQINLVSKEKSNLAICKLNSNESKEQNQGGSC